MPMLGARGWVIGLNSPTVSTVFSKELGVYFGYNEQ